MNRSHPPLAGPLHEVLTRPLVAEAATLGRVRLLYHEGAVAVAPERGVEAAAR